MQLFLCVFIFFIPGFLDWFSDRMSACSTFLSVCLRAFSNFLDSTLCARPALSYLSCRVGRVEGPSWELCQPLLHWAASIQEICGLVSLGGFQTQNTSHTIYVKIKKKQNWIIFIFTNLIDPGSKSVTNVRVGSGCRPPMSQSFPTRHNPQPEPTLQTSASPSLIATHSVHHQRQHLR